MRVELIAIVVSAAYQSALLILAIVLLFRTYRKTEVDDAVIINMIRRSERKVDALDGKL
ncbi:MAG: hypothetical protein JO166_02985 [Deltaproteobacteria bacterium]|nr:hypothetical protein [Deltaproteobacteria bacterium]